jgi:hypothetical protein
LDVSRVRGLAFDLFTGLGVFLFATDLGGVLRLGLAENG